jgi:hypothetical protein
MYFSWAQGRGRLDRSNSPTTAEPKPQATDDKVPIYNFVQGEKRKSRDAKTGAGFALQSGSVSANQDHHDFMTANAPLFTPRNLDNHILQLPPPSDGVASLLPFLPPGRHDATADSGSFDLADRQAGRQSLEGLLRHSSTASGGGAHHWSVKHFLTALTGSVAS